MEIADTIKKHLPSNLKLTELEAILVEEVHSTVYEIAIVGPKLRSYRAPNLIKHFFGGTVSSIQKLNQSIKGKTLKEVESFLREILSENKPTRKGEFRQPRRMLQIMTESLYILQRTSENISGVYFTCLNLEKIEIRIGILQFDAQKLMKKSGPLKVRDFLKTLKKSVQDRYSRGDIEIQEFRRQFELTVADISKWIDQTAAKEERKRCSDKHNSSLSRPKVSWEEDTKILKNEMKTATQRNGVCAQVQTAVNKEPHVKIYYPSKESRIIVLEDEVSTEGNDILIANSTFSCQSASKKMNEEICDLNVEESKFSSPQRVASDINNNASVIVTKGCSVDANFGKKQCCKFCRNRKELLDHRKDESLRISLLSKA